LPCLIRTVSKQLLQFVGKKSHMGDAPVDASGMAAEAQAAKAAIMAEL